MLKNYFRVALRNIRKQKLFAAINIAGLTVGIASCLFIFIYVMDELSYDRFHQDAGNIYRIGLEGRMAGQEFNTTNSCYPVGVAMKEEIPGITDYSRIWQAGNTLVISYNDHSFSEKKTFYVDSNFFSFFSFTLLEGDPNTVLKEPNTMVLSEDLAVKYFGAESALGKMLVVGPNKRSYKITGVAKKAPANSHFQFNALMSFSTIDNEIFKGWTGNSLQTYVRKDDQASQGVINEKLEELVAKHVGPEIEQLGITFEEFKKQGGKYSYTAYPLVDSHLRSAFTDDFEPPSDIKYVYIFSAVGIFILLIACINFMNLSTARSAGRAKEVGC